MTTDWKGKTEITTTYSESHLYNLKYQVQKALTLSEFMIWNLWDISDGLAGSLVRPETNLRNWILSSLLNESSTSQNQHTTSFFSSIPRYLQKTRNYNQIKFLWYCIQGTFCPLLIFFSLCGWIHLIIEIKVTAK